MASAAEAVRALCANFPGFERELVASGERGVGYRVLAGRDALSLDRLHEPSGQQRITIAPVVSGAGGNGLARRAGQAGGSCPQRRKLRARMLTGISPTSTMTNEGSAASAKRSSAAKW